MNSIFHRLTILAFAAGPALSAHGQLQPAPGFASASVASIPGGSFVGGLCVLPDSRIAVFDGTSIVLLDPDSLQSTILHTPPSFVFGSFLVVEPSGNTLLFGESSNGTITRVPLSGAPTTLAAIVPLAYDAAFSPSGDLFLTRGNSSWTATEIVRLQLGSGMEDSIAAIPGPSGPLTFDRDGNLYCAEVSPVFPAPAGSGTVWTWTAAQVESAVGPGSLSTSDGSAFATNLDAITDMAFDAEGDLVIGDSITGRMYALSPFGSFRHTIAETLAGGIAYLAFRDDSSSSVARFDPFQLPSGGELVVVDSDYATYSAVTRIRPRRPTLSTDPASPIPTGAFTLSMNDGAPFSWLHLFAAPATMPEVPVFLLGTPLFLGLAPGAIVALPPVHLDGSGAIGLPVANPGLGFTVYLQGALIDLGAGPLGTTIATPLVLQ